MWLDYRSHTDGTNFYTVGLTGPEVRTQVLANPSIPDNIKNDPTNHPLHMAWIQKGRLPFPDSQSMIAALWYAYCSGEYLRSVTNGMLQPPYAVDSQAEAYQLGMTEVKANWWVHDASPNLPQRIEFFHGSKTLAGGEIPEIKPTPPAWIDFTNAVFDTVAFTNIGLLQVPSQFNFSLFHPLTNKTGLTELGRISYQVKIIRDKCGVDNFAPQLEFPARITDLRFMTATSQLIRMSYPATRWLSDAEVMETPDYWAALRAHYETPTDDHDSPNRTRIVIILFVLTSAALLVSLLTRKRGTSGEGKLKPN
jgi:hypothetical protein